MLNLNFGKQLNPGKVLARGNYGEIVTSEEQVVTKRYIFRDNTSVLRLFQNIVEWTLRGTHHEICSMILELAFNKICNALGIGPKVGSPGHGFDLICFNDCIEYYMEKCEPCINPPEGYSPKNIGNRLKYCIRVMHLLKLIHKDVKPPNLMFSPSIKDLVMVDFGITMAIKEELGYLTKSYREGTFKYMSPDMQSINKGQPEYIDLYYNDQWAICLSINYIQTELNRSKTIFPKYKIDTSLTSAICGAYEVYKGLIPSEQNIK